MPHKCSQSVLGKGWKLEVYERLGKSIRSFWPRYICKNPVDQVQRMKSALNRRFVQWFTLKRLKRKRLNFHAKDTRILILMIHKESLRVKIKHVKNNTWIHCKHVQRQVARVLRSACPAGSETWLRPTGWLVRNWAYVACVNMAGGENVDVSMIPMMSLRCLRSFGIVDSKYQKHPIKVG